MGGVYGSYSALGIDPFKRASFNILRDLRGSLFLSSHLPFDVSAEYCVQSTRTQPSLGFVESYNLQFVYKLEGEDMLKWGVQRKKNVCFFTGRSCAVKQLVSLLVRLEAVLG